MPGLRHHRAVAGIIVAAGGQFRSQQSLQVVAAVLHERAHTPASSKAQELSKIWVSCYAVKISLRLMSEVRCGIGCWEDTEWYHCLTQGVVYSNAGHRGQQQQREQSMPGEEPDMLERLPGVKVACVSRL